MFVKWFQWSANFTHLDGPADMRGGPGGAYGGGGGGGAYGGGGYYDEYDAYGGGRGPYGGPPDRFGGPKQVCAPTTVI